MNHLRHRINRLSICTVTLLLWLLTAALGIWSIILIRDLILGNYVRFVPGGDGAPLLNTLLLPVLALLWIGITLGGAEYHLKHVGEPGSWTFLSRVLAVELAILLLPLFI